MTDQLREALQQIVDMPCSQVNDSDSLRHTIKTLRNIAAQALLKNDQLRLSEAIAAKAAEPAMKEFARNIPQIRETRYLPVTKKGPCAVSSWYVDLPSGKNIIIEETDWDAALRDSAIKSSSSDYIDGTLYVFDATSQTFDPAANGIPRAWAYQLATAIGHEDHSLVYRDFEWRVSFDKPNVPDGSIQSLTPLFEGKLP